MAREGEEIQRDAVGSGGAWRLRPRCRPVGWGCLDTHSCHGSLLQEAYLQAEREKAEAQRQKRLQLIEDMESQAEIQEQIKALQAEAEAAEAER